MKINHIILLGFILTIFGCNKDDENLRHLEGDYIGVFEREGRVAKVELKLYDGNYEGYSEIYKFPAICRGAYSISGKKITFADECPWTAEFDWTLILGGEWKFDLERNILILTKSNGDRYTLTRQ